jgi:hypothetical protein
VAVFRLEGANRDARCRTDAERAPHQRGRGKPLPFPKRVAAAELPPHALGFVAQIHAQQQRGELAREKHDRDKPEQIADAVGGDDVRLQAQCLGFGQAELRDGFRRRADHRRLRRRARQQACRRTRIEMQQPDGKHHEREH